MALGDSFERRDFSSNAVATTLNGAMGGTGAVSPNLAAVTGWPTGGTGPFYALFANTEIVLVTSRSSTTLTIAAAGRGQLGTSAANHASGATAILIGTSRDLDEANQIANVMGNGTLGVPFVGGGPLTAPSNSTLGAAALAANSVTTAKILDGNVTLAKLAADSVDATKIAANSISTSELADNAVDTGAIADNAVTAAKIAAAAAGDGLAGGAGTALSVGAGHGLDVTANEIAVDETELDHGLLGGLSDDDHPQYLLAEEMLGVPVPTVRGTAPDRFLMCYGQTITGGQSSHPDLWAVLDSVYKSGSDIIMPDMRGRVPAGLDNIGGSDAGVLSSANTMGTATGAETITLVDAEMPAHTHTSGSYATSTDGDHFHAPNTGGVNFVTTNGGIATFPAGGTAGFENFTSTNGDHFHDVTGTSASAGSDGAHDNMQPTICMNYMMLVTLT